MPEVKREYRTDDPLETPEFECLRKYLLKCRKTPVDRGKDFEEHEKELHRLMSACEAELLADDLARHDVDSKYVTVDGARYRRALRAEKTYVGQCGDIRVERNLYTPVGEGRSVCPLELKAGIVEGTWTPRAARIMATVVAEMPPGNAAGVIAEFGGMEPSASSLDRIPKLLSERWEKQRGEWEEELRHPGQGAGGSCDYRRLPGWSARTAEEGGGQGRPQEQERLSRGELWHGELSRQRGKPDLDGSFRPDAGNEKTNTEISARGRV